MRWKEKCVQVKLQGRNGAVERTSEQKKKLLFLQWRAGVPVGELSDVCAKQCGARTQRYIYIYITKKKKRVKKQKKEKDRINWT